MKKTNEQKKIERLEKPKKKKKTWAEKYWNEKVICIAGVLYTPSELTTKFLSNLRETK